MPPRPPLTTLVLHTGKEPGTPRPLAAAELPTASSRARIARSMSVDAALSATAAGARDNDNVPHPPRAHARAYLSRSSTFEDALALHAQTAAAGRTVAAAAHALATSGAADGDADAAPRIVTAPLLPHLQVEEPFLSPTPLTLMALDEDTEPGAHSICPVAMEALPPRPPPQHPPMDPVSCAGGQGGAITLARTSASPPAGVQQKLPRSRARRTGDRGARTTRVVEKQRGTPVKPDGPLMRRGLRAESRSMDTGLSAIASGSGVIN